MRATLSDQLIRCECCPRMCGVNRLEGRVGYCRMDARTRISHVGLHFGEEPPISGTRGSGAIFFPGCNLRCVFCQNHQISQGAEMSRARVVTPSELALEMLRLQDEGAHNINFVSPSHMVFQMGDAIREAKQMGLSIPVVYNSNGYDSVGALRQIRGLVDIYLPDIKYMDNDAAKSLSGARGYAETVPEVLREMLDQVGHLEVDDDGIALRGLLVRHLVLPGYLSNTWECLRLLADLPGETHVSIMSQYSPQFRAGEYPGIDRPLTEREYDDVVGWALDLGLENAFIQDLASQVELVPDFAQARPFEPA